MPTPLALTIATAAAVEAYWSPSSLARTAPSAMTASAVLNQARNVRSLARWSRARSGRWSPSAMGQGWRDGAHGGARSSRACTRLGQRNRVEALEGDQPWAAVGGHVQDGPRALAYGRVADRLVTERRTGPAQQIGNGLALTAHGRWQARAGHVEEPLQCSIGLAE